VSLADIRRYEALTLDLWPAAERAMQGGWVLTAGMGRVHRTNAVWPLAFTGADIEAAINAAEIWYRARNLTPAFRIVEGATAPVDLADRLARRGYRASSLSLVMTAPVTGFITGTGAGVRLDPAPGEAMRAVFAASAKDDTDRDERLSILARVPQPARFAAVEVEGTPVACGMGAVRGDVVLVAAMRTHPGHRRKGHARAVLDALCAWASGQGARTVLLQVEEDNPPARALYEPVARPLARYATWVAPA
jgi:GNAT superfamily N-acetyltransferase